MPFSYYTKYPIYYTNSKLGYENQELYAQTLESTTFFTRPNRSYGYYTSKNKPILNPTAENSPVPLAPWFPLYDTAGVLLEDYWGLNPSSIQNLLSYLKPGLKISTYSSTKASDIALAGTRPVQTHSLTSTVSPVLFYPNGIDSGTHYSAIDIVIYVSPKVVSPEGEIITPPKLKVEQQYFTDSTSSTPNKTDTIRDVEIPDVPYFVFNFAVCAPGAPSTDAHYSFTDLDKHTYQLSSGGGSGAGAQFTAILSTNTIHTDKVNHTDKITVRYTLARQSYSSSLAGFDPSSGFSESDNGIDVVKVTADLHCADFFTPNNSKYYPYSRECTLPGGLIYPGLTASYSDKAKAIINKFNNNKGTPQLVSSTFVNSFTASVASALIFHKANWMLPDPKEDLVSSNIGSDKYQLSQPFTVFNPEALFPYSPLTKIGESSFTGPAGRPSILHDGASTHRDDTFLNHVCTAMPAGYGAGASGAVWVYSSSSPTPRTADGGPFTIVLSW